MKASNVIVTPEIPDPEKSDTNDPALGYMLIFVILHAIGALHRYTFVVINPKEESGKKNWSAKILVRLISFVDVYEYVLEDNGVAVNHTGK